MLMAWWSRVLHEQTWFFLGTSKTKTKLRTIFVIDYHSIAWNLVKTTLSASEAGAKKKPKSPLHFLKPI